MSLLRAFLNNERGATAIEYGLIIAIIGSALIGGYGAFSNALQGTFNTLETSIEDAGN